jgi:hypothetical protein
MQQEAFDEGGYHGSKPQKPTEQHTLDYPLPRLAFRLRQLLCIQPER